MLPLPKKLRQAFAVVILAAVVLTSCDSKKADNGKGDEGPPPVSGETSTEQMPVKQLSPDSSSEMPVIVTPDSTATMPNGYDTSKDPSKPLR